MGKKSRTKTGGNEPKAPIKSRSGKNNLWLIMGGAAILIVLVWVTFRSTSTDTADSASKETGITADKFDESLKGPLKLIATLSPDQFIGKARAAYQAAKEIPEILAQLPCFCGCLESRELGHKNNLYCFADSHGNICDLCQTIALEAKEMNRKGIPVEKIRSNIQATYSNSRM